jgi:hypothetical protein
VALATSACFVLSSLRKGFVGQCEEKLTLG